MTSPGALALYVTAPLMCAAACGLTGWQLYRHWHTAQAPDALWWTVALLVLVPLYACCSCASLLWPRAFLVFDLLKDGYEAYALWALYQLLLWHFYERAPQYLKLERRDDQHNAAQLHQKWGSHAMSEDALERYRAHNVVEWFQQMPPQPLLLLCGRELAPSLWVWHGARWALLQYGAVRLLLPLPALLAHWLGLYHHRAIDWRYAYVWLTALLTASISVAVWSLYVLLRLLKPAIWMHAPMQKFLSVKLLVLGLFWQSLLLSLLQQWGALPLLYFDAAWDAPRLAEALHATLTCAELACLALYNCWIWRPDEHWALSPLSEDEMGEAHDAA